MPISAGDRRPSSKRLPAVIRPVVVAMTRRKLRATLHGQGIGRHSPDEMLALATRSIDAIADVLGDKPFFMGGEPTGVDATMFAFVCGLLSPHFETRTRAAAERHDNLRRYVGRMTAHFIPTSPSSRAARRRPDVQRARSRGAASFASVQSGICTSFAARW